MEGEEVLRTLECLRGRLLAERASSRNAKQEAELMGTKLIELEARLKEEIKSRNRAEKRLKYLMKKLESLEIFYVSDESEQSSFVDKSEISSASSTACTSTKAEDKEANANPPNFRIQNIQELTENSPNSTAVPFRVDILAADKEEINSYPESKSQKFETEELMEKSVFPTSVEEILLNKDNYSLKCSNKEEIILNGGGDEEQDDYVDNSMALIPMDLLLKKTTQRIDPSVLDSTVKDVLDALRHAKEKLQTSRKRRPVILKLAT
ncbi:hypothetical protein ACH5RR_004793 [Cinchona calisaya]|uniref:Uncharacterized protein n=1 Tax=Cinchona calisaya TaxID=153742 RepID=A0ABD3AYJ9_9GENT